MIAESPQDQAALWAKVAKPDQVFKCRACGWSGKPELEMTEYHLHAFCRNSICGALIRSVGQVPPDQSIEAQRRHYGELVANRVANNRRANYPKTAFFHRYHFWPSAAVTRQEVKR